MFAHLVSLVVPPACVACRARAGPERALCPSCRAGLRWLGAAPVTLGRLDVWAPLAYDGGARAMVGALKYRGALGLAGPMAAAMAANARPGLFSAPLVPVPLGPGRRRSRGFNQAEVLARELAARTGLAVEDVLVRSGPRGPQVGRGRGERLAGLDPAIALRAGAAAPGAAILVDDVVTTGATLAACARALRAGGCGPVRGVTYARTLGR